MRSYGRIDDIHCAENPRLLDDILRKEWGFDGMVVSDWYVNLSPLNSTYTFVVDERQEFMLTVGQLP